MRPVFALPLFAFAFMLGFNTMGGVCMVRSRIARSLEGAVSTTTLSSASVDPSEQKAPSRKTAKVEEQ